MALKVLPETLAPPRPAKNSKSPTFTLQRPIVSAPDAIPSMRLEMPRKSATKGEAGRS